MLKRLENLLVVILVFLYYYVQCQSPEDENCLKQGQSKNDAGTMQQRQHKCCPVPDFIISMVYKEMQKMPPEDRREPIADCLAYFELFKELGLLQDDKMVDNDKYKEFYDKMFDKNKKEEWKDLMHKSIDKCAESDKVVESWYLGFNITKDECNLDSYLMSRCVLYNAEMVCIEAEKKSSPDCTEVDKYMKSCSKFWFNIEA